DGSGSLRIAPADKAGDDDRKLRECARREAAIYGEYQRADERHRRHSSALSEHHQNQPVHVWWNLPAKSAYDELRDPRHEPVEPECQLHFELRERDGGNADECL